MAVGEASQPGVVTRARQAWLIAEYFVLFFGLAGTYTLVGNPGSPIPALVLGAVGAALYLRSHHDFDRQDFFRASAIRGQLRPIILLWATTAVLVVITLVIFAPHRLFDLPRRDPLIWLAVMIFYPLLSVYPQELIFRAFLFHRYAPVFGTGTGIVAASAAAFGFVHIIYGEWLSVLLTAYGGWLFARRYQQSRSLAVVWLEHALYGLLGFTIGLGSYFYNGPT